ncbi:hypothetical protein WA577_002226 [Blastocystis sp. JDR]
MPLGRVRRFEKDLKSRTAVRFHLEDDAEQELGALVHGLLRLVVESIRENEVEASNPSPKKRKRVVSVFDVERALGSCKQLPGWNAVCHSRNYETIRSHNSKPKDVNPLLWKDPLLVEQEEA